MNVELLLQELSLVSKKFELINKKLVDTLIYLRLQTFV